MHESIAVDRRKTAANSVDFFDQVTEHLPFPIQRVQTDRGGEFFGYEFQQHLLDQGAKFRPIRPRSPHLNGKAERSQRTDLDEFYATVELADPELEAKLSEWEHHYSWDRPHGSLNGKTPIARLCEVLDQTPTHGEVSHAFDLRAQRIQEQRSGSEMKLRALKRSL